MNNGLQQLIDEIELWYIKETLTLLRKFDSVRIVLDTATLDGPVTAHDKEKWAGFHAPVKQFIEKSNHLAESVNWKIQRHLRDIYLAHNNPRLNRSQFLGNYMEFGESMGVFEIRSCLREYKFCCGTMHDLFTQAMTDFLLTNESFYRNPGSIFMNHQSQRKELPCSTKQL
ncbi:MAG: hypothetical protein LBI48_09455 [Burkholderiaceae bacterium]|jgi:hypothetical protein|nr:hypothetical protein [Burkholderiaceae bacterium]